MSSLVVLSPRIKKQQICLKSTQVLYVFAMFVNGLFVPARRRSIYAIRDQAAWNIGQIS